LQIEHADMAARTIVNSGVLLRGAVCAAYLAHVRDGELDTVALITRLWSMGKTVGCPVVGRGRRMDFYRLTPSTHLIRNRYDILEPSTRGAAAGNCLHPLSLSLMFIPVVGFDDAGTRLGMGSGYYDRYLGRLSQTLRPLLVGLAHETQRSKKLLPHQQWDIPLDAVVTEAGWQAFSPRAGSDNGGS
jgi:5-formyltetrahydrofolate cyclo-ligase